MWQEKTRNKQNDTCKLDCHALLPNLDDWMISQEVEGRRIAVRRIIVVVYNVNEESGAHCPVSLSG